MTNSHGDRPRRANETRPDLPTPAEDGAAEASAPTPVPTAETSRPEKPRTAKGSIAGSTWVALICGALVLIVLLAFIMQNMDPVQLSLFAWSFELPLGVGMLFAAIFGALLMALVGGIRILQLRKQVKR